MFVDVDLCRIRSTCPVVEGRGGGMGDERVVGRLDVLRAA